MTPRRTVMIEGAGTATCLSVLKGLSEQTRHDVRTVVLDMDADVAGRYVADAFHSTPGSKEPGYVDHVLDLAAAEGVDLFIPIVDYGFEALAAARHRFEERGIVLMIGDPDAIAVTADKKTTAARLSGLGLPTPTTWTHDEAHRAARAGTLPFPCFLKPRRGGRGALGTHVLRDVDDLAYHTRGDDNVIVQPLVRGREFTADCLASLDGQTFVAGCVRERVAVKGGLSVKARMMSPADTARVLPGLRTLAADLRLPGVFNVQGWITDTDDVVFSEINPRFAGTHAFTIRAGLNSAALLLDLLDGAAPRDLADRITFDHEVRMVRYWTELFVDGDEVTTWTRFPLS